MQVAGPGNGWARRFSARSETASVASAPRFTRRHTRHAVVAWWLPRNGEPRVITDLTSSGSARARPPMRRTASRAETYSRPVRHSSVRSRCPGSAALAASGSSADGSATGSGVEAIQGLLVLFSDNAALDLERRCQLATVDGEVVVEHRPLLDRLPPIQAGVQLFDVLVDHVVHLIGFREVLIRLVAQPVVFGPPADRVLIQSDQSGCEVLALAEHHELTGVRAQRREFRLDRRRP